MIIITARRIDWRSTKRRPTCVGQDRHGDGCPKDGAGTTRQSHEEGAERAVARQGDVEAEIEFRSVAFKSLGQTRTNEELGGPPLTSANSAK
ncbi:unnamed protein product [Lampetra planeri]